MPCSRSTRGSTPRVHAATPYSRDKPPSTQFRSPTDFHYSGDDAPAYQVLAGGQKHGLIHAHEVARRLASSTWAVRVTAAGLSQPFHPGVQRDRSLPPPLIPELAERDRAVESAIWEWFAQHQYEILINISMREHARVDPNERRNVIELREDVSLGRVCEAC